TVTKSDVGKNRRCGRPLPAYACTSTRHRTRFPWDAPDLARVPDASALGAAALIGRADLSKDRPVMSPDSISRVSQLPLRVFELSVYRGPHLFSNLPMVRIQLDLGALEAWPTDRLP